jgi:3-hydroxyisobutyrate dehydrogenase-like beta-hydroxyacid dehydrogenase
MKVGFIGLGRIGGPMARRLAAAGHDLTVHDREPERIATLVANGAHGADSVGAASADRDVVMTSLPDDEALLEVSNAAAGVRESLPAGGIHVVLGTHGIETIRELAASHSNAGQSLVSAPVFGRPDQAEAGTIRVVTGGAEDSVSRCAPLLEVLAEQTYDAGVLPESAAIVKLANNLVLGCAVEAFGEAISLLRKHDVSPGVLYDVATEGFLAAPVYKVYGRTMLDQSYDEVGFTARLGLKDMDLVLDAADAAYVPLPSVNAYRDRLLGALAHGEGDLDLSVVAREQARASGLGS